YTRLAATAPVNSIMPLPAPTADDAVLPFMDPAFATAVCRYDLASGPLQLRVPVSQAYTSVSFYARSGVAYYAINDRAAGRRIIELDLMTTRQRAELPDDEEVTAADRLIVESPTATGLILIRTFGPEPGLMPMARRALASATAHAIVAKGPASLPSSPMSSIKRLYEEASERAGVHSSMRAYSVRSV